MWALDCVVWQLRLGPTKLVSCDRGAHCTTKKCYALGSEHCPAVQCAADGIGVVLLRIACVHLEEVDAGEASGYPTANLSTDKVGLLNL